MLKCNKISFIEVKTRTCGEDSAERSFDKNKKAKMFKAIEQYCQAKKLQIEEIAMYIEQISVYIDKRNKVVKFKKYLTSLD